MTDLHYRWTWDLTAAPESLWPWISDTNRFNQESGVPPVHTLGQTKFRRRLALRRFGVPVEWDEEPFEWIRPRRFGVIRRYHGGPMVQMRVLAELLPRDTGSRLEYAVWATPRNGVGSLAIKAQMLLSARNFSRTVRRYDRSITEDRRPSPLLVTGSPRLNSGGKMRLDQGARSLIAAGLDRDLVERLARHLRHADDLSLHAIRPYELADLWQVDRAKLLELFLHATRSGLVEFRWELLCPLCRGAKQAVPTLAALDTRVHCDACNIDLSANFEGAVELRFRVNPSIRDVQVSDYCVGGPQVTPHIVLQQVLAAGASRTIETPLESGAYRVRLWGIPGSLPLHASAAGPDALTIPCDPASWPTEAAVSLRPRLELRNPGPQDHLMILERSAWTDQAVTASDLSVLPLFRDLFSTEILRPAEKISVGGKAVLFTDIRNSTRMYREIGDAPAFGRVIRHFDVLNEVVRANGGVVVKTIGDGSMAVFRDPASALHAACDAQHRLAKADPPLTLKAGVHFGALIAVTLNDRLDFFGTTVNLTARLAGLSEGDDIAVSRTIVDDPEVAAWLAGVNARVVPVDVVMKGFEDSPFDIYRLYPRAPEF